MLLLEDALREMGEVEEWIEDMEAGDEDLTIAILLTLLPELRTLRIKELPLNGVTFAIIQYNAEYKSTTILSELEEVEISYDNDVESKFTSVIRPFWNVNIDEKAVVFELQARSVPVCRRNLACTSRSRTYLN